MARTVADPSGHDRFTFAGLRVLHESGAAELTLRRAAQQADSSTMGIYSCLGGRAGLLEAIYQRGFELVKDAITVPRQCRTRTGDQRALIDEAGTGPDGFQRRFGRLSARIIADLHDVMPVCPEPVKYGPLVDFAAPHQVAFSDLYDLPSALHTPACTYQTTPTATAEILVFRTDCSAPPR